MSSPTASHSGVPPRGWKVRYAERAHPAEVEGIGEHLEGIARVELDERHAPPAGLALLVGEEAVEAADDVGSHRRHRPAAVEQEVDVDGGFVVLRVGRHAAHDEHARGV